MFICVNKVFCLLGDYHAVFSFANFLPCKTVPGKGYENFNWLKVSKIIALKTELFCWRLFTQDLNARVAVMADQSP